MKRNATENLEINDLRPGDVLLSLGHGLLSDAILFLDGGRYSHAGFFDGEKVVEATRKDGIAYRDVTEDLKVQKFIDVYRYRGDQGQRLGTAGFPVQPLIDVATRYRTSGSKFAWHQLLLLALLATGRQAPLPLFLKKLLRTWMDEAVSILNEILQDGKQPVICSELLYRIFYEPPPKNQYGLTIEGVIQMEKFKHLAAAPPATASKFAEGDEDVAQFDRLSHQFCRMYVEAKTAAGGKRPNPLVKADFVTPRDLETSPNLEKIGPLAMPVPAVESLVSV